MPSPPARSRVASRLAGLVAAAIALAAGCAEPAPGPPPPPARAFYFWRTRLELTPAERGALERLHVDRVYLRLFDVEWSAAEGRPRPVATVELPRSSPLARGVETVPVVFLRAEVLARAAPGMLAPLAEDVWQETRLLAERGALAVRELQLDCDWTDGTRAAYFELLRRLGALARPAGVSLSATIRLHQVKYRERTGVPPVERGMLMFYNMGSIDAAPDRASIFDPASAARYTARISGYPLPLDVALPIWAWTIHLRGDEVVGLLQSTDPAELAAIPWLRPIAPARFVATRTTFLHGELLREGDVLKGESMGAAETLAAARMASAALPASPASPASARSNRTVALFDLSERNLARHADPTLVQLFSLFR